MGASAKTLFALIAAARVWDNPISRGAIRECAARIIAGG